MSRVVPEEMKRLVPALVMWLACSCGTPLPGATTSPTEPSSSPVAQAGTPSPSTRPNPSKVLAVVSGPGNLLRLVAADGAVFAATTFEPPQFRAHLFMSWTSASLTRLYYLNGGSEVRYIEPNGNKGSASQIAIGAGEQAGFAVSPDDKRIAVAVFTYTPVPATSQGVAPPTYKGMRMYVEDLQGGGHHVDIYSSATVAEFPIGWTAGRLVVAVTSPLCCQALPLNPYDASAYHVVNPENGDRITSLCDNSYGPSGPIEPVGTMCIEHQDGPTFTHWDGSPFPPPAAVQVSFQYLNALSPDGTQAAAGGDPMRVLTRNDDRLPESGYVFGWLDESHIVFQRGGAAMASLFDLASRSSTDLPGNEYLGTFPAAIS